MKIYVNFFFLLMIKDGSADFIMTYNCSALLIYNTPTKLEI